MEVDVFDDSSWSENEIHTPDQTLSLSLSLTRKQRQAWLRVRVGDDVLVDQLSLISRGLVVWVIG